MQIRKLIIFLIFLTAKSLFSAFVPADRAHAGQKNKSGDIPQKYLSQLRTTKKGTTIIGLITRNGKPLKNATVVLREFELILKSSNDGSFKIFPVPKGDYTLKVYHPRVQPREIPIRIRKGFFIRIEMKNKIYRESVRIAVRTDFPLDPLSVTRDSGQNASLYPGAFGVSSFYLSTLPSVSSPLSYLEKPIVRGQNPADNQVLFNGTKSFYPFHGQGITSIFNKDRMQEITVYRGVVPVNYRNVGSGLIDFTSQVPGGNDGDFSISLNPLEIGSSYGSLWGNNGYITVSGRVTPIPFDPERSPFYHNNFQGSAAVMPSRKHRFQFDTFGMNDYLLKFGSVNAYRNSNSGFVAKHDYRINSSKKIRSVIEYQRASLEMYGNFFLSSLWNDLVNRNFGPSDGSETFVEKWEDFKIDSSLIIKLKTDHVLETGALVEYTKSHASMSADFPFLDFETDSVPISDPVLARTKLNFSKNNFNLSAYARYLARQRNLGWDAGIRSSFFGLTNSFTMEPSLMGFYFPTGKDKVYLGSGLYYRQWKPRWLVYYGENPKPLKPVRRFKLESGYQRFFTRETQITLIIFREYWHNQPKLAASDPNQLNSALSFQVFEATGKGKSYGAELIVKNNSRKFITQGSYSFTRALNEEGELSTNRTHMLTISLIYDPKALWIMALVLRVWSTFPLVDSSWGDKDERDIYWLKVDPVTQVSLRFTRKLKVGKRGSRFFLEVGQFQSIIYLFSIPPRWEFTNTKSTEEALMGRPLHDRKSFPELPLMIGFGLEVIF